MFLYDLLMFLYMYGKEKSTQLSLSIYMLLILFSVFTRFFSPIKCKNQIIVRLFCINLTQSCLHLHLYEIGLHSM